MRSRSPCGRRSAPTLGLLPTLVSASSMEESENEEGAAAAAFSSMAQLTSSLPLSAAAVMHPTALLVALG